MNIFSYFDATVKHLAIEYLRYVKKEGVIDNIEDYILKNGKVLGDAFETFVKDNFDALMNKIHVPEEHREDIVKGLQEHPHLLKSWWGDFMKGFESVAGKLIPALLPLIV